MGLFDKFASAEVKNRRNTIKINPYELPDVAAQTIAKICAIKKQEDNNYGEVENFFKQNDYRFLIFIGDKDKRGTFANVDFWSEMKERVDAIRLELESHENNTATQVVVAGGFSAGKSSFLNTISEVGNLLPTGINPVSMVSTYLYFSTNTQDIKVAGVNQAKAPVKLNKDILQSIKHADDNNRKGGKAVTLAAVLNKLLVELPAKNKILDGLCFIDTPGYNNDMKANADNGVSDKAMAMDSFKYGNVLFWIVDAEAGTINAKDEEMIQDFVDEHEGNCKVVVIFNKADKKRSDIGEIVNSAFDAMQKKSYAKDIIDILGYTCTEQKILYSKNGYNSISDLLNKVKASGNGYSTINRLKEELFEMFNLEIRHQEERIECYKEQLKDINKSKTDERMYISDFKDDDRKIIDRIEKSYDEVLDAAVDMAHDFNDFFLECEKWDRYEHSCWDNTFTPILKSWSWIKEKVRQVDNIDCYYQTKVLRVSRYVLLENVKENFARLEVELSRNLERYDSTIKRYNDSISECQTLISQFKDFLLSFKKALEKYICDTMREKGKIVLPDASYGISANIDVFDSIKSGDYETFRLCFATNDGVSLLRCNAEGYSALTYAVKMGNTEMVKFFLNHKADASAFDQRGFNAFHTAAQNHNMAICQMLLNEDASLKDSMTKDGKTATQIASESTFTI